MNTPTWSEFLKEVVPNKRDRDFLQLSFGKLMSGVAFKSGDLGGALGEPSKDAGRLRTEFVE